MRPSPTDAFDQRLATDDQVRRLANILRAHRPVVLTGAGCSTESGIPDYRGPGTRRRARNPMTAKMFLAGPSERQRYWSRSFIGWPRVRDAVPNAAHRAIAHLQAEDLIAGLITQNVDRLHQKAGASSCIELHGALAETRCLDCQDLADRQAYQERLSEMNGKSETAPHTATIEPDGDAELGLASTDQFVVPGCSHCGGSLKPNVVFFGESVDKQLVLDAYRLVDDASSLLVIGSSLAVFSGFRFVRRASAAGKPIWLINLGETRGQELFAEHFDAVAGDLLERVVAKLT